jgi:hypothetical protein
MVSLSHASAYAESVLTTDSNMFRTILPTCIHPVFNQHLSSTNCRQQQDGWWGCFQCCLNNSSRTKLCGAQTSMVPWLTPPRIDSYAACPGSLDRGVRLETKGNQLLVAGRETCSQSCLLGILGQESNIPPFQWAWECILERTGSGARAIEMQPCRQVPPACHSSQKSQSPPPPTSVLGCQVRIVLKLR